MADPRTQAARFGRLTSFGRLIGRCWIAVRLCLVPWALLFGSYGLIVRGAFATPWGLGTPLGYLAAGVGLVPLGELAWRTWANYRR